MFLEYVLLVKNNADDWSGILLHQRKVEELAKHHIFPKEFLQENLSLDEPEISEIYINNLGNITIIHKDVNVAIGVRPPSDYLPEYQRSIEAHFISSDKNLWTVNQYFTFLE